MSSTKNPLSSFPLPDRSDLSTAANVLSLLSHPQRLEILCHLSTSPELSAGEIVQRIGLSQSATSQHLARLRKIGLLETRKEGQSVYYRIARKDVGRILEVLHELYCRKDSGSKRESPQADRAG